MKHGVAEKFGENLKIAIAGKLASLIHCLGLVFSCCLLRTTVEGSLGRQTNFIKQGYFLA